MSRVLLIRGARQLLTLCGERGPRGGPAARELRIIPDGAVLIVDGKIAEVGPSRRVERLAVSRKAEVFAAHGRVVMPAFVDCCVSLLCGTPWFGGGGAETEARELRSWSSRRMDLEVRERLKPFLRAGTLRVGAGCGMAFDGPAELKALRVLNSPGRLIPVEPALHAYRIPPEFEDRPGEYRDWLCRELIPRVRKGRLAGAVETADWPDVCQAAAGAGLPCRIRRPDGTVSANGVTVHLPDGEPPRDDGKPVALSTGFHSRHRPFHSMQTVIWLARTRWRMTVEEAISAATINAAHALGVHGRVGSLEPGKDADLLFLQTGDCRDLGWYAGTSLTAAVMRQGSLIFPRMGPSS